MKLGPFTDASLLRAFQSAGSSSKHLLTIYSMVVGLDAKVILDLGVGATTRALRAGAEVTGGTVYSCDRSAEHYAAEVAYETDNWKMFIGTSKEFLAHLGDDLSYDLVMHDAAHDYARVKEDLETIMPRMKQFGIVVIHDTQHNVLGRDMYRAIDKIQKQFAISTTTLPYGSGLTIMRVEESDRDPVKGLDAKRVGDTRPFRVDMFETAAA